MIKIVKPAKQYVPKYGNIDIYGKYHEYLESVDWEMFRTMNPMNTRGALSCNPWTAMINAGISGDDIHNLMEWSKNHCPCSDMDYYAMVPICILTSDATRYLGDGGDRKPWYYDMLNDDEWNRHQYWGISPSTPIPTQEPEEHMGPIVRAMLGSGYTDFIMPNDGGHSLIFAAIPLDNGDKLIIISWEWYNK